MIRTHVSLAAAAILAVAPSLAGSSYSRAHALCFGETSYVTGMDIEDFVALREARMGDFLWFRRDGKRYLVTDAGVLDAAREALRPWDPLRHQRDALDARLKPYEDREEEMDREDDTLDDADEALDDRDDASERGRIEARRSELEAERRALRSEMRALEEEERRLDAREQEVEGVVDAEIERLADDALRRGLAQPMR
jgi:hypothetical protein